LARRDHVAFIDEEFRDAPGKLGVDIDFVGFEATISEGDAGRQPGVMLLPPPPAYARAGADKQQQSEERDTRSPPPLWPRRRSLDNRRETAALFFVQDAQLDACITALRSMLRHQYACSWISGPDSSSGDLDEIGVAKPLAVIENGNDFRRNAEQGYLV
jgi:hypothetical protein